MAVVTMMNTGHKYYVPICLRFHFVLFEIRKTNGNAAVNL